MLVLRTLESIKPAVTLTVDSWKNIRKQSILGFAFVYRADGKAVGALLSTENISAETYTAEDVVDYVNAAKGELSQRFGVEPKFLVCDSAGSHIKARKLLKTACPSMLYLPCYAHQINLWVKDALQLPILLPTCKTALDIITHFNRSTFLLGTMRKFAKQMYPTKRGLALEKPTETRWYSFYKSYRSVLDMKLVLQRMLEEKDVEEKFSLAVRVALESASFWKELEIVLQILEPLVKAQAITESSTCTLCDVVLVVKDLYVKFASLDLQFRDFLLEKLEDRWKRFFDVKLMILAVALHPGHGFSTFSANPAKLNWLVIKEWSGGLYKELFPGANAGVTATSVVAFMNKESPFNDGALSDGDIRSFWMLAGSVYLALAKLGLTLYEVCPHAADVERMWSLMSNVVTKPRNRLMNEKARDVVTIKLNVIKEKEEAKQKADSVLLTGDSEDVAEIFEPSEDTGLNVLKDDVDSTVAFLDLLYVYDQLSCDDVDDEDLNTNGSVFLKLEDIFAYSEPR